MNEIQEPNTFDVVVIGGGKSARTTVQEIADVLADNAEMTA